jgi:putative heme iron utilization protein
MTVEKAPSAHNPKGTGPKGTGPKGTGPKATEQAQAGRRLMRTAVKGALGTIDHETGHPYASLVLVATEPDGTPVLLLSTLARHTKNLGKDPRASLLLDGTGDRGEPLTGDRLTLIGEARPGSSPTALRRFISRHPSAGDYAGFGDFSVYTLRVSGGHFIGGFGRIFTIEAPALLTDTQGAQSLVDAEPDIIAHMNADHSDAVALYATGLAGCAAGDPATPASWRMSGIDPDGADLLQCTNAARIEFPNRIGSPGEARQTLVELVQQARAKQRAGA